MCFKATDKATEKLRKATRKNGGLRVGFKAIKREGRVSNWSSAFVYPEPSSGCTPRPWIAAQQGINCEFRRHRIGAARGTRMSAGIYLYTSRQAALDSAGFYDVVIELHYDPADVLGADNRRACVTRAKVVS